MGVYGGTGIIEDGLILHLDAANTKSYTSGLTWTDLSSSKNNATLTAGATKDSGNLGSILFDASGEYATVPKNDAALSQTTFIVWLNFSSHGAWSGILYNRLTFNGSTAAASGMNFYSSTNQLGYTWNNSAQTYGWQSGLVVPSNKWCMCALSVFPTYAKLYLNYDGTIYSATNNVANASLSGLSFYLGVDPESLSTRITLGKYSIVQIYNRGLSDGEIKRIYDSTRTRY